jgi:hypothetical protein
VVAALGCLLVGPAPSAQAASVTGGALNHAGEKSHNIGLGFPELFYVYEGLVRERSALGLRVGLQVWPLSISLGGHGRVTLKEKGMVAVAVLIAPSFNLAGFGGSRATYPRNLNFGRSRTLLASLGPGLNVGLLATIDVRPKVHILATFENPVALWLWATTPPSAWLEWPILLSIGAEFDATYNTSFFGRVGGGPSLAFTGPSALLGFHWHVHVGVQIRK